MVFDVVFRTVCAFLRVVIQEIASWSTFWSNKQYFLILLKCCTLCSRLHSFPKDLYEYLWRWLKGGQRCALNGTNQSIIWIEWKRKRTVVCPCWHLHSKRNVERASKLQETDSIGRYSIHFSHQMSIFNNLTIITKFGSSDHILGLKSL